MARRPRGHVELRLDLDLGEVDAPTARRLLADYGGLVRALAQSLGGDDDLVALGEVAVLEAYLRHRKDGGRALAGWVRRVVWWRLCEAVRGSASPEEPLGDRDFAANGKSDIEAFLIEEQSRDWLQEAIERLPRLRHRAILAARLEGATLDEIAGQLGLSKPTVHREAAAAVRALRLAAIRDGVVD